MSEFSLVSEFLFLMSEFSLASEFWFVVTEFYLPSEFWFSVSEFSLTSEFWFLVSEFLRLLSEFSLMSELVNSTMQQQMELLVNRSSCLTRCAAADYFAIDCQSEHSEYDWSFLDFYLSL